MNTPVKTIIQFILAALWRWDVVGIGSTLLYGFGVGAMYGDDYIIAILFYFLGVVWLTAKFLVWEEIKLHPKRSGISIVIIILAVIILGLSLLWTRHRHDVYLAEHSPPSDTTQKSENHPTGDIVAVEKGPILVFGFYSLDTNTFPLLAESVQVEKDVATISFFLRNMSSTEAAMHGEITARLPEGAKYAKEPDGFLKVAGAPETDRETYFDSLNAHDLLHKMTIQMVVPREWSFAKIGLKYGCQNCGAVDNWQSLTANFVRPSPAKFGSTKQTPSSVPNVLELRVVSQESIVSDKPELPFAERVVVQTNVRIQPVSIVFEFTAPIGAGNVWFGGEQGVIFIKVRTGPLIHDPHFFIASFESPGFEPDKAMIITVYSKEPIQATGRWQQTPFIFP